MSRLWSSLVVLVFVLSSAPALGAEPSPDVLYPDDPDMQRVYELGFSDGVADGRKSGYDEGYDAGQREGADTARDEDDLREQVEGEATASPPTPSPTAATTGPVSPVQTEPREQETRGFPWWPLSFAVVATAWFVTRRRRLDAEDERLMD